MTKRNRVVECVSEEVIDRCRIDFASLPKFDATAAAARVARGTSASCAAGSPPLLTGGESPFSIPVSLNGERSVVDSSGEFKTIPGSEARGKGAAFVDWITFTFHETSSTHFGIPTAVTDDDVIKMLSLRLSDVLGIHVTAKREKGMNFYHRSYNLGDDFGYVCHGGQRGTIAVILNGKGCAAAKEGWERRLYNWLESGQLENARITRIDLAHDDFNGERYSVDRASEDYDAGAFNTGGRNPDCEQRGNWKRPTGKGRSFYIGARKSGKFSRVYEKGRQLGDKESPWVRVEVEYKSTDRIVPFETLIQPGEYLAGAYPAFAWVAQQCRIQSSKEAAAKTFENSVRWCRHQYGKFIAFTWEMLADPVEFVRLLANPDGLKPEFFKKFDVPMTEYSGGPLFAGA